MFIFSRVFGFVCGSTPCTPFSLGTSRFLLTTLNGHRDWQIFECDKLRVVQSSNGRLDALRSATSAVSFTLPPMAHNPVPFREFLFSVHSAAQDTDSHNTSRSPLSHSSSPSPSSSSARRRNFILVWHQGHLHLLLDVTSSFSAEPSHVLLVGSFLHVMAPTGEFATFDVKSLYRARDGEDGSVMSTLAVSTGALPLVVSPSSLALREHKFDVRDVAGLLHPDTWVNKVVTWTTMGLFHVLNVDEGSLVHTLDVKSLLPPESSHALGAVRVVRVLMTPVLDVVLVVLSSSLVVLVNLRLNVLLLSFLLESSVGTPTCLAFRTQSQLLVGDARGFIHFIDLDQEKKRADLQESSAIAALTAGVAPLLASTTLFGPCHEGLVGIFFPQAPATMVTQGADNCLRMWVFDAEAPTAPRALKVRSGHSVPPTVIHSYESAQSALDAQSDSARFVNDFHLLSAGPDRALRFLSLMKVEQSFEFSQGHVERRAKERSASISQFKLQEVIDVDSNVAKQRDWANIVTAHRNDCAAYLWQMKSKALTSIKLVQSRAVQVPVRTVRLSPCGNFAVVGLENGRIDLFNVQSGKYRGSFGKQSSDVLKQKRLKRRKSGTGELVPVYIPPPKSASLEELLRPEKTNMFSAKATALAKAKEKEKTKAKEVAATAAGGRPSGKVGHRSPICCLHVSASNSMLISLDVAGLVIFWDFRTMKPLESVDMAAPVGFAHVSVDSSLIAVSLAADGGVWTLVVVDTANHAIIRQFAPFPHAFTALQLSADSRLLLAAGADGSLRVFDLPSNRLIEWLHFDHPVRSLIFSARGDFLATAHFHLLGVYVWANKFFFHAGADASEYSIVTEPKMIFLQTDDVPAASKRKSKTAVSKSSTADELKTEAPSNMPLVRLDHPDPLHWLRLAHLEESRAHMRAGTELKRNDELPFFLQAAVATPAGATGTDAPYTFPVVDSSSSSSRAGAALSSSLAPSSSFVSKLRDGESAEAAFAWLRSLSPSSVEGEIALLTLCALPADYVLYFRFLSAVAKSGAAVAAFDFYQSLLQLTWKKMASEVEALPNDEAAKVRQEVAAMARVQKDLAARLLNKVIHNVKTIQLWANIH